MITLILVAALAASSPPPDVFVVEPDADGNCWVDPGMGDNWVLSERCPVIDLDDVRLPVADGEPDENGDGWVDGTEDRRVIDSVRPCTWEPDDEFVCPEDAVAVVADPPPTATSLSSQATDAPPPLVTPSWDSLVAANPYRPDPVIAGATS